MASRAVTKLARSLHELYFPAEGANCVSVIDKNKPGVIPKRAYFATRSGSR